MWSSSEPVAQSPLGSGASILSARTSTPRPPGAGNRLCCIAPMLESVVKADPTLRAIPIIAVTSLQTFPRPTENGENPGRAPAYFGAARRGAAKAKGRGRLDRRREIGHLVRQRDR